MYSRIVQNAGMIVTEPKSLNLWPTDEMQCYFHLREIDVAEWFEK
jgi:hypothetical protein